MKIKGWQIDGFGIFKDHEVSNLGPGLAVFVGPNEAGKSTLLAFLRSMLFGFAVGEDGRVKHQPLYGGRHGGRLILTGHDGDVTIERHSAGRPPLRVVGADSLIGDESLLARLLAGADDRIFSTIFAVDLADLQSLSPLRAAERVRDRLFGGSGICATHAAREAARAIEARAVMLLGGSDAIIPGLARELHRVSTSLEVARQAVARYPELLADEARHKSELEALTTQTDALRASIRRCRLLVEVWPAWHELQVSRADLEELACIDEFPADADARLTLLISERAGLLRTLDELRAEQAEAETRNGQLHPNDALAAVAGEVAALHDTIPLQRDLLQQLQKARAKLYQTKEALDDMLRSLGPGWTEARVDVFDRSIGRQEELRAWQQRLNHSAREVAQLRDDIEQAIRTRDDLEPVLERLKVTLGAQADIDFKPVEERLRALRRLHSSLAELQSEEDGVTSNDSAAKERDRALRAVEAALVRSTIPEWLHWALAGAAAIVGAGTVWAYVTSLVGLTVILGIVAPILFTSAIVAQRRLSAQLAFRATQEKTRLALAAEFDDTTAARVRHRHRAALLVEQVAAQCRALDLGPRPSLHEIAELEVGLSNVLAEHRRATETATRIAEVESQIEVAIAEVHRLTQALHAAQHFAETERSQWEAWKHAEQLPAALSPQGVLDFYDAIRAARERMYARTAAKAEGLQVTQQIGEWEDRARAVLDSLQIRGTFDEEQVIRHIADLHRQCTAERTARSTRTELEDGIRRRASAIQATEAALQRAEEALAHLYDEADAGDETTFRQRREIFERRSAVKARVRDLEGQIVARIGHGPEADALLQELSSGRLEEWRETIGISEARIPELHEQREETLASLRAVERRRREVETSDELARLDTEHAALLADLVGAIHEWQVLTLARNLLVDTAHAIERTRQPGVLPAASRLLQALTGGRYPRVVLGENGQDLALVDEAGRHRTLESLSRGTSTQVHLSLRLALAVEYSRGGTALPIVLDDTLVHFDAERAAAMARVLADLARDQQVFVFTCHPTTRDLLLQQDPGASLIELRAPEPHARTASSSGHGQLPASEAAPELAGEPVALVEGLSHEPHASEHVGH